MVAAAFMARIGLTNMAPEAHIRMERLFGQRLFFKAGDNV
jgi:hypothetical protein